MLSSTLIVGALALFAAIPSTQAAHGQTLRLRGDVDAPTPVLLAKRAAASLTVHITSSTDHCLIAPRNAHTTIGDSEDGGNGARAYCLKNVASGQGTLPSNFWTYKSFKKANGASSGVEYKQITGCINPASFDRLVASDDGGQYDSSGGDGGNGNPAGSVCTGYNHYVELIEPSANRACIRCCKSPQDCILTNDEDGCRAVIPGSYKGCN